MKRRKAWSSKVLFRWTFWMSFETGVRTNITIVGCNIREDIWVSPPRAISDFQGAASDNLESLNLICSVPVLITCWLWWLHNCTRRKRASSCSDPGFSSSKRRTSKTGSNHRGRCEEVARWKRRFSLSIRSKACPEAEVEQRRTSVITRYIGGKLIRIGVGFVIAGERNSPYLSMSAMGLSDSKVEKRRRQEQQGYPHHPDQGLESLDILAPTPHITKLVRNRGTRDGHITPTGGRERVEAKPDTCENC